MSMSVFRSRRQPRHAALQAPDERSAPEAIAAVPDPECFDVELPPAQHVANRVSGPQPVFIPNGAADLPGTAEAMMREMALGFPRREHPYGPPVQVPGRGAAHTQAWKPDFAEPVRRARPYVPSVPLPPEAEVLPPQIGDELAAGFPWQALAEPGEEARGTRQRTMSLNHPEPGAGISELREYMRTVDEVTGTRGKGRWPLAALPAADERWSAMADALQDAAEAFGSTEMAKAHGRLREYVLAAPDFETARRLTQVANEAWATGYLDELDPAAPEETSPAGPEAPDDGTAVTAGEASS
jgi:hypothetical protein